MQRDCNSENLGDAGFWVRFAAYVLDHMIIFLGRYRSPSGIGACFICIRAS